MSDANNGIDDYRSKNQMNGTSGNNNSSSGASAGNQYVMNQSSQHQFSGQQYPYGQPVQPQMGQSYGRHAQPQMSQPQFGKQQFAQQYSYSQPYGQPVQPRMSQQPPYCQPPMGRPYGRPQYGGAPFAARAGYVNGRFNPAYIEEQARKFSFRWNAKEIISAIIVVVVAAIFAFVFTFSAEYGFDFSFNISQIIRSIVKYRDEFYILENVISYMQRMFPLVILLSFAQVLRKRFFTIAGGFVVATSAFLTLFFNRYTFGNSKWILGYLLECATIVVFFVSVEILQWLITKYKPENDLKYMLVNFISVIIFCIANAISTYYWLTFWDSSTLRLLLDIVESFIVAIPMLVFLPCLVALLLKAVKFTKFLNPEREMMHL
ncbi:hypothetical protein ACMZ7D_00255 [Gardnerella vaginalis]|uniref:Uncharacterized protein n=1 Tax=Gardnerella vaginalis TaxID=2702 RepID=A0A2K1SV29_GARVA|nr:hypothetical protein [Gardnerella vaginalis]PNS43393.1 hypothetical protein BFS05_02055 [Gardnerella vaginalis]